VATALIDHIEVDDKGTARVSGTRMKVTHIAVETRLGLSPAQIREQYPHLSLAQIHAALAYYYDHQSDLDAQIDRSIQEYEQQRQIHPNPLTREELLRRQQEGRLAGLAGGK
jgi:uncharacterized protein (DUF433 family)